jgi:DNA-binding transcriptional MerR regulator
MRPFKERVMSEHLADDPAKQEELKAKLASMGVMPGAEGAATRPADSGMNLRGEFMWAMGIIVVLLAVLLVFRDAGMGIEAKKTAVTPVATATAPAAPATGPQFLPPPGSGMGMGMGSSPTGAASGADSRPMPAWAQERHKAMQEQRDTMNKQMQERHDAMQKEREAMHKQMQEGMPATQQQREAMHKQMQERMQAMRDRYSAQAPQAPAGADAPAAPAMDAPPPAMPRPLPPRYPVGPWGAPGYGYPPAPYGYPY